MHRCCSAGCCRCCPGRSCCRRRLCCTVSNSRCYPAMSCFRRHRCLNAYYYHYYPGRLNCRRHRCCTGSNCRCYPATLCSRKRRCCRVLNFRWRPDRSCCRRRLWSIGSAPACQRTPSMLPWPAKPFLAILYSSCFPLKYPFKWSARRILLTPAFIMHLFRKGSFQVIHNRPQALSVRRQIPAHRRTPGAARTPVH